MPSEKEQFFWDEKQISLLEHNAAKNFSTDTPLDKAVVNNDPLSITLPAIVDVNLAYGLKNVKIELPKVNIPNEVLMKHEVDRFRKLFQCKQQTARKSITLEKINGSNPGCSEGNNLQNKPEVQFEEESKTGAKVLNFCCSKCKNNIRYSPNDLEKHFQMLHYGELPLYPCEMCNFSANDFQSLKQHRYTHRSSLAKCELCNDEQVYALLDLLKHFTSKHCVNGHFQCEKCGFSTRDVGTFVQHIRRHNEVPYKCGKCHQENFTEEELQNHLLVHSGMFAFDCQYCSYSTSQKDYLLKHVIALHRDHLIAKEKLEEVKYEERIVKTPAGLKLVVRRYPVGASKKPHWRQKKVSSGSGKTGEENAQVLRSANKKNQTYAEERNQCMRDVEAQEKDQIKIRENHNFMGGKLSAAPAQYSKAQDDGTSCGLGLLKNTVHGPTVFVVKNNKISVPANYSAKFMGFKMVDGKQHIVIKIMPTNKQNEYLLGQKADPIKDGSTTPLLQTADPCGLSSGAIPHVTDQATLKNNSVHPLTSPPFSSSAPCSGKTKVDKPYNSLLYGRSVPENVAPSNIAVGKSSSYSLVKMGSTVTPHDRVTEVGTHSWGSHNPSSHPQVLPPSITNPLHYGPVKMPFFPELKIQNGGLNNSNRTDHLYYSTSVDSPNEKLLSFHNYSKMNSLDNPCRIWMSTDDRHKDFRLSKTVSFQNNRGESASSCSESMKGLKAENVVSAQPNINKTYKHINDKNNFVSFKSQSKCDVDSQCRMEGQQNGQQYLDTNNLDQGFRNVAEEFQENDSGQSFLMPKITSVFSLQSEEAAHYLLPELCQQDVLEVKKTTQQESHSRTNNCVKLHSDKLLSGPETGNTAFMHLKSSATARGFQRPPPNVDFHLCERELNTRCSTDEGTHCGRERETPRTAVESKDTDKLSVTPGVGTLRKTLTGAVITQQLVKNEVLSPAQNPSSFSPVLPVLQEQKKTLFIQSPPSGFFVPLQPGPQVVDGRGFPETSSSDGHVTKGVPASFVSNKGSGMILTLNGAIGTLANANDSSQVLGGIASREFGKINVSASEVKGKNCSSRNIASSCNRESCSTANDSLNSRAFKGPLVITNSSESSVRGISSMKVLPQHQDAVLGSLESVKQQEMKQEQRVYALLPDGQQGVFLRYVTPNKPVVHKPSFYQDNANYQNCQPKKTGAMQQQLLLRIKTPTSDTLAGTTQSASNSVPSLQVHNLQSVTPALAQKQTNLTFNDALILPGGLMPANASSANSNPAYCVPPVESGYSTKSAGTQLQKGSVESMQVITANNRNNFSCQKSTWSTQNQTTNVKPNLKQTGSKSSVTVSLQRKKKLKRKRKSSCPEPPRKKVMLHKRCKEKNRAEVVSESGSPYKPRASKKTVRTLKLLPFSSNQLVKCPRRNQPVVVLNHPDADVPEVVNVMKTVYKFKGHVLKVSLSKRTIEALLQPTFCNPSDVTTDDFSQRRYRTIKPINPVKERFVLKLTLKKTSKNNYQIVKTTSNNTLKAKFSCWFCGRIFDNQDNWVGHGQRHLMEATRDWNSLM
ncbi:Zinc finger protein 518A, partial [Acanthisitta chloris]